MSDKKITQLNNITGANLVDADEFVVVDISADETKAITLGELKEAFDAGSGFVRVTGDTMTGDLSFGDNDKAIFGGSNDLQIWHDATAGASKIYDAGAGNLELISNGGGVRFSNPSDEETFNVTNGGATTVYHNRVAKLATTSTGIDVTGTVTADGLTVDAGASDATITIDAGTAGVSSADAKLQLIGSFSGSGVAGYGNIYLDVPSGGKSDMYFQTAPSGGSGGQVNRLKLNGNGDISFYEDTGTTPKFFWDASAESLGIGGASTAAALETRGNDYSFRGFDAAGNFGLQIYHDGAAGISKLRQTNSGGDLMLEAGTSSGLLFFNTAGSERMRIDSSGNVGIGTSSPTRPLSVTDTTGDGTGGIKLASYLPTFEMDDISAGGTSFILQHDGTSTLFKHDTSETMRIDSSGNLLVGQTSIADYTNTVGSSFRANGFSSHTRDGEAALLLNRLTSDGEIVTFRKDGSTVGSVATWSGDPAFMAANSWGLKLYDQSGNDIVHPINTSGNTYDGNVSLGYGSSRFKDLYLSGGVYLGGTGSANKLDDYEEGTWTPTYSPSGNNFSSITYNTIFTKGTYIKIGNTVIVRGYVRTEAITAGSASGVVRIGNLPFVSSSGIQIQTDIRSRGSCTGDGFASNAPTTTAVDNGSSYISLLTNNTQGSGNSHIVVPAASAMATGSGKNVTTFTQVYVTDA